MKRFIVKREAEREDEGEGKERVECGLDVRRGLFSVERSVTS